jgi:hypothetical protein
MIQFSQMARHAKLNFTTMRLFITVLTVLVITSSCVTVEFTEAQPAQRKALDQFPEFIQGTYLMAEYKYSEFNNLDTLIIEEDGYVGIFANEQSHHLVDLPELDYVKIKDSLVYRLDRDPNRGYPFTIEDSVLKYKYYESERATLADSMVFKEYKGEYYLSFREEPGRYSVILMKPERNGDIGCWAIDPDKDIDLLKSCTDQIETIYEDDGDVDKYIVSPSAQELDKFTRSRGFSELVFRLYRLEEF